MNIKFIIRLFTCSIVGLVFAVFIVNLINGIPSEHAAHNNDWIPFYGNLLGGLIGGIIGSIITFKSVEITIKNESIVRKQENIKRIRPVLSSDYRMLSCEEIENLPEKRGAILEIAGEQTGNGEALDREVLEKYLDIMHANPEDFKKKYKIIEYHIDNQSNSGANNVEMKLNKIKVFEPFPILPKGTANIYFIIHLSETNSNEIAKITLEFNFKDELYEKKYIQYDQMSFRKDDEGNIHHASHIMAMTCPEEIN